MQRAVIVPSLLSADFSCLKSDIKKVEQAGAGMLHLDVMDGHFVPNISFGDCVVKAIRKTTKMVLDAHLMISDPLKYYKGFASSGADIITFHIESPGIGNLSSARRLIAGIKSTGKKCGVSIKPATPVEKVYPVIKKVDLILIMTVEPGFSGQEMIENALEKIVTLRKYINRNKLKCFLSVDGGINLKNAASVAACGADLLVCGSSVFTGKDPGVTFKKLSKLVDKEIQVR